MDEATSPLETFRDPDWWPRPLRLNGVGTLVDRETAEHYSETDMPETFRHSRLIEFRDTDMAGIVHFSNFFAYMEQAEHAFLRSIGLGVFCTTDGIDISWPRVNANCNYRQAIRFEETIDIDLTVVRIGNKSITYDFQFSREGTPVADGSLTAVCCKIRHGEKPESVAIPTSFLEKVQPFLRASS